MLNLRNSNIYIYIYIYILCCPFLFSQETLKEWSTINCENKELLNFDCMWGCETGDNRYILSRHEDNDYVDVLQFTANGDQATLEAITSDDISVHIWENDRPYLLNDRIYFGCEATSARNTQLNRTEMSIIISCKIKNNNIDEVIIYNDISGYDDLNFKFGQGFPSGEEHYCLMHTSESKLWHLKLELDDRLQDGDITPEPCKNANGQEVLTYSAAEWTSIVVLQDTLYYFDSDLYLCALKISGLTWEAKKIDKVQATDAKSVLVTDNKNRVWMIDKQKGVIEYNTTKDTADTIANHPVSAKDTRDNVTRDNDTTRASFYLSDNLYYIANDNVYALEVKQSDDPNNPDDPTRPHDQSGHTCGLLGCEFLLMLLGLWITRLCHK